MSWCITGLYIASASRDNDVIIWDVSQKSVITKCKAPAVLSALAWHPGKEENILAGISEDGCITLWRDVIPEHLPRPANMDDPSPGLEADNHDDGTADLDGKGHSATHKCFPL